MFLCCAINFSSGSILQEVTSSPPDPLRSVCVCVRARAPNPRKPRQTLWPAATKPLSFGAHTPTIISVSQMYYKQHVAIVRNNRLVSLLRSRFSCQWFLVCIITYVVVIFGIFYSKYGRTSLRDAPRGLLFVGGRQLIGHFVRNKISLRCLPNSICNSNECFALCERTPASVCVCVVRVLGVVVLYSITLM